MTTINTKLICLLLLMVPSCKNINEKNHAVSNKFKLETDNLKDLKIQINDNTKFKFPSLFLFTDKQNTEYLTFISIENNSILFYDFSTSKFLFELELDAEGPNGVGMITGYYIENWDNIYVTSNFHGLSIVDSSGIKKQFIEYKETDKGHYIVPNFTSSSFIYTPTIIHNEKVFITQLPYQASKISETPVSVAIDTISQTIEELPFRFPHIIPDNKLSSAVLGTRFSRDFNGKEFLYSFFMDENIYATDVKTNKEKKIRAKSKYIEKLTLVEFSDDRENVYKSLLENSHYYNMLYDKYRNIYYRFAIIGSEIEHNSKFSFFDIYTNGFIQFSVIIMNENFDIIGETLFPKYIYNPTIAFVHKNGLYISDSHIQNSSFNENVLSFKCFSLKKDE